MKEFNIGVELEEIDEMEIAKQKVANFLDEEEWRWLKARLRDERMSWPVLFDLVAAHL